MHVCLTIYVSGVLDNVKAQLVYSLAEICEKHTCRPTCKLRCIAF